VVGLSKSFEFANSTGTTIDVPTRELQQQRPSQTDSPFLNQFRHTWHTRILICSAIHD